MKNIAVSCFYLIEAIILNIVLFFINLVNKIRKVI